MIGCLTNALVWGFAGYWFSRKHNYPRKVKVGGFKGIVRETAKLTLLGSGAGFITSIISKDLKDYPFFQQIMLAVLIVSLSATVLNYWMSAALDTRTDPDGKLVKLTSRLWEVVHGIIFGLSLAAMVSLLVAIIAFAAKF